MSDSNFFAMDFDNQKRFAFAVEKEAPMLSPPVLNVYLAGPLTNNDLCTDCDCRKVREIVKLLFGSYEYNGIHFNVYDPGDITAPGTTHSPEEVYELDHERTVTADLVVFHVNVPSLGVGCECQISADASSPKVIIAKKGAPLSRMFVGVYSATLAKIEYENPDDVEMELSSQLPSIASLAVESARRRRPVMEAFAELKLGRVIFRQRILHNVSLEELAKETDTSPRWLQRLERVPAVAACCSSVRLKRIADVTQCYLHSANPDNIFTLKPSDDSLSREEKESLDNLIEFIFSRDDRYPEDRVFRLWNGYRQEFQEETALVSVEHREGHNKIITVGEWRERDQRLGLF